jgi:hypothetical protein
MLLAFGIGPPVVVAYTGAVAWVGFRVRVPRAY